MNTPQSQWLKSRRALQVSGPVYRQLEAIQARMQADKGRQVTFSEVIEEMLAKVES